MPGLLDRCHKRIGLLFLAMLLPMTTGFGQAPKGRLTLTYTEAGTGTTRYVFLYVPETYDPSIKHPVLFSWHASGMPGSNMREMTMWVNANIGAIVLCPDVNGMMTNSQVNMMLDFCLNYALGAYNIDRTRFVIMGYSLGGRLAFQNGLRDPSTYRGIIGLAPAITGSDLDQTMWSNVPTIPMALLIGERDSYYPSVSVFAQDLRKDGGRVLSIFKPGVTHVDTTYYTSTEFRSDFERCYAFIMGTLEIESPPKPHETGPVIAPHPVRDRAFLTLPFAGATGTVTIADALGRVIRESRIDAASSQSSIRLPVEGLHPGLYLLRFANPARSVVRTFIKTE